MGMDINARCLGPKQNFQIQYLRPLHFLYFLKVLYETKKKKKNKVLDFSQIEYYKEVLDFHNIEYHITFLIIQILG